MTPRTEANMGSRAQRIRGALENAFKPIAIEIADESAKHSGHAGNNGVADGETHFRLAIVSEAWAGQSRLARARAVHEALAAEFKTGLHAVSLSLRTPAEAEG